jgi:ribosomal protein S18 acetylase RimI-like enzyme
LGRDLTLLRVKGRIRGFKIEDYQEIVSLWKKVGLAEKGESTKEDFIAQQKVAKDLFLVYEIDGKIAGTVIGGWDGWRAWIYRIAVAPKYQRKGIGSKLISEITKRLVAKRGGRFRALIMSHNDPSKSLFQKTGFKLHEKIILATKDDLCC